MGNVLDSHGSIALKLVLFGLYLLNRNLILWRSLNYCFDCDQFSGPG